MCTDRDLLIFIPSYLCSHSLLIRVARLALFGTKPDIIGHFNTTKPNIFLMNFWIRKQKWLLAALFNDLAPKIGWLDIFEDRFCPMTKIIWQPCCSVEAGVAYTSTAVDWGNSIRDVCVELVYRELQHFLLIITPRRIPLVAELKLVLCLLSAFVMEEERISKPKGKTLNWSCFFCLLSALRYGGKWD